MLAVASLDFERVIRQLDSLGEGPIRGYLDFGFAQLDHANGQHFVAELNRQQRIALLDTAAFANAEMQVRLITSVLDSSTTDGTNRLPATNNIPLLDEALVARCP